MGHPASLDVMYTTPSHPIDGIHIPGAVLGANLEWEHGVQTLPLFLAQISEMAHLTLQKQGSEYMLTAKTLRPAPPPCQKQV